MYSNTWKREPWAQSYNDGIMSVCSSLVQPLLSTGLFRAGCSGPCPFDLWLSARMEVWQALWSPVPVLDNPHEKHARACSDCFSLACPSRPWSSSLPSHFLSNLCPAVLVHGMTMRIGKLLHGSCIFASSPQLALTWQSDGAFSGGFDA